MSGQDATEREKWEEHAKGKAQEGLTKGEQSSPRDRVLKEHKRLGRPLTPAEFGAVCSQRSESLEDPRIGGFEHEQYLTRWAQGPRSGWVTAEVWGPKHTDGTRERLATVELIDEELTAAEMDGKYATRMVEAVVRKSRVAALAMHTTDAGDALTVTTFPDVEGGAVVPEVEMRETVKKMCDPIMEDGDGRCIYHPIVEKVLSSLMTAAEGPYVNADIARAAFSAKLQPLRDALADLETRADPAGDLATIASLRQQLAAVLFERQVIIDGTVERMFKEFVAPVLVQSLVEQALLPKVVTETAGLARIEVHGSSRNEQGLEEQALWLRFIAPSGREATVRMTKVINGSAPNVRDAIEECCLALMQKPPA